MSRPPFRLPRYLWFSRQLVLIASLLLSLFAAASATASASTVYLTQFPVSASAITTGPDGNLWFTTQGAIGRLTPTGSATPFALPDQSTLTGITPGPDGNLWFATPDGIGRITTSGAITLFPIASSYVTCTVNPSVLDITSGPDGNVWLGETNPTAPGEIGRITPTGEITWFTSSPLNPPLRACDCWGSRRERLVHDRRFDWAHHTDGNDHDVPR